MTRISRVMAVAGLALSCSPAVSQPEAPSLGSGPTRAPLGGPASGCLCDTAFQPGATGGLYSVNTWTGGRVYYTWDPSYTVAERAAALAAMAALPPIAQLQFIERTTEPNYIYFTRYPDPNIGQSTAIGMAGGQQQIRLGLNFFLPANLSLVVHEICHALGMWHEQQRADRDQYITVQTANIQANFVGNYSPAPAGTVLSGPYDFSSTMHYNMFTFSNGGVTMRIRWPYARKWQEVMGFISATYPNGLSPGDKWTLQTMYGPVAPLPPRPFAPVAPAFGAAVGSAWTPVLSWNASEGATAYRVVVDDDPLMRSPEIDTTTTQTSYAAPAPLAPGRLYWWSVTATNAQGSTLNFPLDSQPFYTAAAYPATLFVDDSAPAGGQGTSWADAMPDLRMATETAYASGGAVTEIRVGQGVYRPNLGSTDRFQAFVLPPGCAIRGGFAGYSAPNPDARDTAAYPTILTGDFLGDDGPNFANMGDNAYHVVVGHGPAGGALDGLTIRGGNADAPVVYTDIDEVGGGVVANGGPVTIQDCVFTGNRGAHGGAGALLYDGAQEISRCRFAGNTGLSLAGGALSLLYMGGVGTVTNSLFAGNSITGAGTLEVFCKQAIITNCTLVGNSATGAGSILVHSNFPGPTPTARVRNTICWGNTPSELQAWTNAGATAAYLQVDRSVVAGGQAAIINTGGSTVVWGAANSAADPRLVAPAAGDLHLRPGSPCIDLGDNTFLAAGSVTDLDGLPRFADDPGTVNLGIPGGPGGALVVDLGAYEFHGISCYANCDGSSSPPILNVNDFQCFLNRFAQSDPAANCDASTSPPILNVNDFQCFLNLYAQGCP